MEPTTNDQQSDIVDNATLTAQIEALLFSFGGMSKKDLTNYVKASPEKLEQALATLRSPTPERGTILVDDGTIVELRATQSAAALIEKIRKEEYNRDIGRAGLEVLAAVLYRGAQTRAHIDFIRGVNSSQTLRTLTMRGLLRKVSNPRDERSYLFEPTVELLAHLGITHTDELPEYEHIKTQLATLEAAQTATTDSAKDEIVHDATTEAEQMTDIDHDQELH